MQDQPNILLILCDQLRRQGNRRCIVTPERKLVLIESRSGTGVITPWQLFDRRNDPDELRNLITEPGYQWTICTLVEAAIPVMRELEDPFYTLLVGGVTETSLIGA